MGEAKRRHEIGFKRIGRCSVATGMSASIDRARTTIVLLTFRDEQGERCGQYQLSTEQAAELAKQLSDTHRPEGN